MKRYNMQPRAWLNRVTVINADTFEEYKRVQELLGDSDELIPLINYVNEVYQEFKVNCSMHMISLIMADSLVA